MIYASSVWQKHREFFIKLCPPSNERGHAISKLTGWFFVLFRKQRHKQPVKSEGLTAAVSPSGCSPAAQCCWLPGDWAGAAQRCCGCRPPNTVICRMLVQWQSYNCNRNIYNNISKLMGFQMISRHRCTSVDT